MGGAAAGEVAASMAVELVDQAFIDPEVTWPTGELGRAAVQGDLEFLVAAIARANHRIHGASAAQRALQGMGTTIAALLLRGSRAVLAHVGDSRIFRVRNRHLDLLTEDHTLFNAAVRAGFADPEHPERFERRNTLTRALGGGPTVEVDARYVELRSGDAFLLCSDGLTGVVRAPEIEEVLATTADLDVAAARLIDRANELGGPDNVTIVLVRV
jgi:protein phosphatase